MRKRFLALTLLCLAATAAAQSPTPTVTPAGSVPLVITPSSVSTTVGSSFDLVVEIQAGSTPINAAAAYLDYDSTVLTATSITPGSALSGVLANTVTTPGQADYAAWTLSGVPTGTFTLCTVHFTATATTAGTSVFFNFVNPRMSGAATGAGQNVTGNTTPASIVITAPVATTTPTSTVPPTATATSPPAPACCGDIDGNGIVTQQELAICQSVMSEALPVASYPACDCNSDGVVDSNELLRAAHNLQFGCPLAPNPNAPPEWSCNPKGTDGAVEGQLHLYSNQQAPFKLPSLSLDPTPGVGVGIDAWYNHANHKICVYDGGKLCTPALQ